MNSPKALGHRACHPNPGGGRVHHCLLKNRSSSLPSTEKNCRFLSKQSCKSVTGIILSKRADKARWYVSDTLRICCYVTEVQLKFIFCWAYYIYIYIYVCTQLWFWGLLRQYCKVNSSQYGMSFHCIMYCYLYRWTKVKSTSHSNEFPIEISLKQNWQMANDVWYLWNMSCMAPVRKRFTNISLIVPMKPEFGKLGCFR